METGLIPDSVFGAVLLSVIDFFLSFVVISFIGVVLSAFPLFNRLAVPKTSVPVVFSVIPERDQAAEHAAVIAAAVYHVLGGKRIVHIGQVRGGGWAAQIRSRLHTSHMPHK
ncbi:MAG: hypothetical protein U1E66_07735 [Rhodospirillales bacterium]